MQTFWIWFYNALVIPVFWTLVHIAGWFNPKVRRAIRGRQTMFDKLAADVGRLTSTRRIWFHSSSMGEFEQAKPIIAALRARFRDLNIIVSFFSPSGYDHSKNYKLADVITYIPFDSRTQARRFLDLIRPTAAVMVRYDVWPNHIWELRRRNVPTFIANATMRDNSSRFLPIVRSFHRALYNNLTAILTVSEKDVRNFRRFGISNGRLEAIGETRYDQVWQRSEDARQKHVMPPQIIRKRKVIVVGSSWPDDEEVLLPTFRKILKYDPRVLMILVPHEPTVEALDAIEMSLGQRPKSIRFSVLNDYNSEPIIVVDSVGILMSLYQYADVSYVGGSFRQGIHNVLEPAVYGIPVVYGPKHENSQEAQELVRRGGGFVVRDQQECYRTLRTLLGDDAVRSNAGAASLALVKENIGATERFVKKMEGVLKP